MSWKIGLGNFLRETGLGKFLIILLVVFVIILLIAVPSIILNRQSVQTEHVEVVSKRLTDRGYTPHYGNRYSRFITFKFPDGSEIEFNIKNKSLDDFQEGDTGKLTYKQVGNSIQLSDLRFVSFEKNS